MTNGVLFYAFNNDAFDYIKIANLNSLLVQKHMKVPTAIITDDPDSCVGYEEVITILKPEKSRRSFINTENEVNAVDWYNRGRFDAILLSPFDKTFLLDVDYLIFNDNLNSMYDTQIPFSCSSQVITTRGEKKTEKMSFNTLDMEWATALYFDRSSEAAIEMMKRAAEIIINYKYYSLQCGFLPGPYRNDYALTIALNANHGNDNPTSRLPPLFTVYSQEKILRVNTDGSMVVEARNGNIVKFHNTNVHIMNKTAIIDHYEELETYAKL